MGQLKSLSKSAKHVTMKRRFTQVESIRVKEAVSKFTVMQTNSIVQTVI